MAETPESLIQRRYNAWRVDWSLMAREALGVKLDPEQQEILTAIQNNRRVSVRSGTSRGKDYVAAVAALCFLYTNFPAKVILTGPTDRQVRLIMMAEIDTIIKRAKIKLPGRFLETKISFPDKRHYLVGFKAQSEKMESWSGFHSPNIMVVVTEATGIAQTMFDGLEGILQGNSRLLIVFNPNRRQGEAYRSVKSPQYVKFKMNGMEAPNVKAGKILYPGQVDTEWVDERVKMPGWTQQINAGEYKAEPYDFEWKGKYYRPGDLFLVKVMGEFPREAPGKLIPLEWIEAAQARYLDFVAQGIKVEGQQVYGNDIAGQGRDRNILCSRRANFCYPFEIMPSKGADTHMATAGRIKALVQGTGHPVFIDTIGEGAGTYSRLAEQGVTEAVSAKFSFVRAGLTDYTGQHKFRNMRAFCLYAIRDWLNPAYDSRAMLPPDDELIAELNEPIYKFYSDGKILIEPKEDIAKRLGGSPDKMDALGLSFWPFDSSVQKSKAVTKADYGLF